MSHRDPLIDISVVQDAFRQQVKLERSNLLLLGISVIDCDHEILEVEPAEFREVVEQELRRHEFLATALQGQRKSFYIPKAFYELLMYHGLELDPDGLSLLDSTNKFLAQLKDTLPPQRWTKRFQQLADASQFHQFHAELAVAAGLHQLFPSAPVEVEPRLPNGKRPDFRFATDPWTFYVEVKRYFDDFYEPGEPLSRPGLRRITELRSKLDGCNGGKKQPGRGAAAQLPPGELNLLFIFDSQGGMERPVGLSTQQQPSNLRRVLLGPQGLFEEDEWKHVSIVYRCNVFGGSLVTEPYVNPHADVAAFGANFGALRNLGQPTEQYRRFFEGAK